MTFQIIKIPPNKLIKPVIAAKFFINCMIPHCLHYNNSPCKALSWMKGLKRILPSYSAQTSNHVGAVATSDTILHHLLVLNNKKFLVESVSLST